MEYLIRDHQRERLTIALALLAMTVAAPCAAESSSSDPAVTIDFANGLYARRMYGPAVGEYEKFIRLNPDSPELPSARFRAADSRYFSGSYKSAVFYFKEFIRDFPGDGRVPMARFRTALARYHLGEFAPAARIFVALAKESPDPLLRSGALFYLGKIYESRKNPERALEIFRRLMGLYPRSEYSAYAALAMGERFIGERDFASAAGAYEFAAKVADASPENAALREKALLGLFACDYSRRDLKTALRRWQSHKAFIAGSACEPQILYLLADLESEKREGSLSVHFLEKVIGHPQADDGLKEKAFFKKCETLSAIGEAEEALAGLEEYLNGGKGDLSRAGYEKARALEALGRAEEAARIYRGLVTTVPESAWTEQALYEKTLLKIIEIDLDRRDYAKASEEAAAFVRERPGSRFLDAAHYKLGVSLAGLKDYGRAAEAFGKVGEGSPWHGRALYGLAACLENQKLPDAAIRAYEKINALYPGSGFSDEAFSRLVYLYLQSGEPEKAALLCGEILSAKPTVRIYPDAAFWLAEYLLGRREFDRLLDLTGALSRRFPGDAEAHATFFFKGEALLGLGSHAKALDAYSESLRLEPDGGYAARAHLGMGLAYSAMNDPAAEKSLDRALRFDDETGTTMRARFEIADLRRRSGDLAEAAKGFMLVAILYDDDKYAPLSLARAAECFETLGKKREASEALAELKARYPSSEWAGRAGP